MFTKVLVANRGEIAVRILRTLRAMGIESVAVYADADGHAPHVGLADEAVRLPDGPPSANYLSIDAIVAAARDTGAQAVHPGYGFLSERAAFAEALHAAGIVFVGPSVAHLRDFGEKHTARAIAQRCGVPLLTGTDLLVDEEAALTAAERIGYPVMLKASAGGGGIGMRRCDDATELRAAFAAVQGLAARNFGGDGVFLERCITRARHIEVQVFGNGTEVVTLGERECSAQRRHQKVIEECPAPNLDPSLRAAMVDAAAHLAAAVGYRSAGTVEFVVDDERQEFAFLEVNTRLQVEHGVTELVWGLDLVDWMVREAAGALPHLRERAASLVPDGHAIEVRVYAEDPARDYQPSPGTLTNVELPAGTRVDAWIAAGQIVSPFYDPMLAKIMAHGPDRETARRRLDTALTVTRIDGVCTNLGFLRDALASEEFVEGRCTTTSLERVQHVPRRIEVVDGGMQTTVQDTPGRLGHWDVGVPPSGPMDDLALRRANQLVGNADRAAGLECTRVGPTLRFTTPTTIALTGARMAATLDGAPLAYDAACTIPAGATLRLGPIHGPGARTYLAVAGGIDVPEYLGARATFMLGGFGGHAGRALQAGDALPIADAPISDRVAEPPGPLTHEWTIGVLEGPHGAPEFFTEADADMLHETAWEVHHHSDRTGVRLIGPAPQWARTDGGEAGLHPSNIHDTAYAIGTIDFTGDMPVILGPDGPSLGGFVCPLTIVRTERWKMGQLSPGDTVRFVLAADRVAIVARVHARAERPEVTFRRAGDEYVLVEFGPMVLDLELRARVHALQTALAHGAVAGVAETVPGIRSLQVRIDGRYHDLDDVVDDLVELEASLPDAAQLEVPSRIVHLPLSWADPSTQLAVDRYMQVVRDDAPWCPSNLEFIRRINGLGSIDDVRDVVFDANYLVLGLGDVYLGAPVATPLDPRHRLVTTKYNPARTWTPENAVGIGGAYMCVYGMEGPGGYQFVGRTLQMWRTYGTTPEFPGEERWLLRWFDQVRFHPVSAEELLTIRSEFAAGRHRVEIEPTTLRLADYREFLTDHADSIAAARTRQTDAFAAERDRWVAAGEFDRVRTLLRAANESDAGATDDDALADGVLGVTSPVHGVVQKVPELGRAVAEGEPIVILEAMKTETALAAPCAGTVVDVRCQAGAMVTPGRVLVGVAPE